MAVIVTSVFAETATVVTVNVAELWPAGTVITGVTRAAERLLVASVTEAPPTGAGALSSTVPWTLLPPTTLLALSVTDCKGGGAFGSGPRLMKADFVTPPAVASMRTVAPIVTGLVVRLKLFALFPAATETVAGTWATAGLSLLNVTRPPPTGAGMTSSTVPRMGLPPIPDNGFTPSAKRIGATGGPGSISSSFACVPPVVPYVA